MDSVRLNYNKIGEQNFSVFIDNIKKESDFKFKAHHPANEKVMQDRYTFSKKKFRISIVYETKPQTLIITAPKNVIDEVRLLLPATDSLQTEALRQRSESDHKEVKTAAQEHYKETTQNQLNAVQEQTNESAQREPKPAIKKELKAEQLKTATKRELKAEQSKTATHENSFILKKISSEKFSELLKKIKINKNMRYKQTSVSGGSKSYTINTQKEKVTLRYLDGNIELSGVRGDLYGEIQLYMSQLSDYKTAIKTHIKFSGEEKRARDIERQLKKKLPDAYEFLSEQSKLDLAIGIIDINNSEVVLSDYSTLLIPCFRGLERFIFDLQHAQGIVVKMIGQAFEKDDGNYVLKSGYRRKIPSVIYPEVMAALYTEYFKQRNFYAHSDGGFDNISRIISDKEQVQSIFNHILDVINYNGKKLKEIGFTVK